MACAYAAEKEAVKNGHGVIDVDAAKAPRPRIDAAAPSAFTDESSSDDEDGDTRAPLPPSEKEIVELRRKDLEAEFEKVFKRWRSVSRKIDCAAAASSILRFAISAKSP